MLLLCEREVDTVESIPRAGFDPPCPRRNDLLNKKVDDLDHQASTAGPVHRLMSGTTFE